MQEGRGDAGRKEDEDKRRKEYEGVWERERRVKEGWKEGSAGRGRKEADLKEKGEGR